MYSQFCLHRKSGTHHYQWSRDYIRNLRFISAAVKWLLDARIHYALPMTKRKWCLHTFLGVLLHNTDKPQPMALHAYCHGVPAERVVSRINPRTEITINILNVQFIALLNLFIRFIKFNKQWNSTTKHYGLFCNTITSLQNVTCHNQQHKIFLEILMTTLFQNNTPNTCCFLHTF